MAYLIVFNWAWLLAAAVIGLGMGWISVVHRGQGLSRMAVRRTVFALAVMLGLSLLRILPGRFGYALDLGLVIFGVYLLGCFIGSWLRYQVVVRFAASN